MRKQNNKTKSSKYAHHTENEGKNKKKEKKGTKKEN